MAHPVVSSVFRAGLFADKVAIVTGGGTGIGAAIAQELHHLGCNVMIAARNADRLQDTRAAILKTANTDDQSSRSSSRSSSSAIVCHECNIRKEDEVDGMVSEAVKRFGKVDYLVNNAGGQYVSKAKDIKAKGWHAVLETNLTGTFYCCKAVYHHCMQQHGGRIVNIIADMVKGLPVMAHSGAARAGVDNLTKTLAVEWADSGVCVNAVAPGSSIYSKTAAANYGKVDIFHDQIPHLPAKRLGTTEEISAAVVFLLSPGSSFISGTTVRVDGAHSLYACSTPYRVPDHHKSVPYTWSAAVTRKAKL